MKNFLCPYCYEKHSVNDCQVVCTTRNCPKKFKDEFGNIDPEKMDYCLKRCRNSGVSVTCPTDEVMRNYNNYVTRYNLTAGAAFKLDIPREIRRGEKTFTIAVIGGPFSGKSNYLAVLINELMKKFSQQFKANVSFLNDSTNVIYDNRYYTPIFRNNQVPEKTLETDSIPPLMYKVTIPSKHIGFIKRKFNMVFYDVAGEALKTKERLKERGYIGNADLIIVLVDPSQLSGLDVKEGSDESPNAILTNIENIIRDTKSIHFGRIKIPVAFVLSKVDKLKDKNVFDGGDSPVLHESEHLAKKGFSEHEFKITNGTMKAVFDNLSETNPVTQLESAFKNYALFGVSALGGDPDNKTIHERNTFRVLDPIIWFLHRKGYIKDIPEKDVNKSSKV